MSALLAFVGFSLLIVLHEAGHFAAAKAVGMRVERFSLFFGRHLVKFRRGETEYGIGWIPLGGLVKISGMSPLEELPPEVAHRAYVRQPVWKRIVVIIAGPLVNIILAFLILWLLFWANGVETNTSVEKVERGTPAAQALQPGDRVVSIDGVRGDTEALAKQLASHTCAGTPVDGCAAQTPAKLVVERDGETRTLTITPRFDDSIEPGQMRVGLMWGTDPIGPAQSADRSTDLMWRVTSATLSIFGRLVYSPEAREEVSGVVGSYEVTRRAFNVDIDRAILILGLISLSLALVNLLPFLPLDGGHIFWALAEKVRGRAIPFSVMERASVVGLVLIGMLFLLGLTNDIERLGNGGFDMQ